MSDEYVVRIADETSISLLYTAHGLERITDAVFSIIENHAENHGYEILYYECDTFYDICEKILQGVSGRVTLKQLHPLVENKAPVFICLLTPDTSRPICGFGLSLPQSITQNNTDGEEMAVYTAITDNAEAAGTVAITNSSDRPRHGKAVIYAVSAPNIEILRRHYKI